VTYNARFSQRCHSNCDAIVADASFWEGAFFAFLVLQWTVDHFVFYLVLSGSDLHLQFTVTKPISPKIIVYYKNVLGLLSLRSGKK
jgi:hypothetical protein